MLEGVSSFGDYIHRSMWYEPLLLMAGHLSIVSPTHANALIRDILDHPSPYDDVLQRNTLLAAECLADDVQVKPNLRDEVLEKLATLLMHRHPRCRRCQESLRAPCHESLLRPRIGRPETHHRTQGDGLNRLSFDTTFNLASALVNLGDRDAAWPFMQIHGTI